MDVIGVPYHLDEYLPDLDLPLRAEGAVTADMAAGDVWERLASLYSRVAAAVRGRAERGVRPVVVSGDCTTALGTVAGLQVAGTDPGIVWFDAHGDVQTLETTASGYLGGLPLRLLAGYRPELIAGRLGLRPAPEDRILLVGARDLDPPEVTYLDAAEIRRCEVTELTAQSHGASLLPDGPLYVHVDLDVIDSAELPGLRYPAPGGPAPGQVAGALGEVLGTRRVAALGIACTWYPGHAAAQRVAPYLEGVLANADLSARCTAPTSVAVRRGDAQPAAHGVSVSDEAGVIYEHGRAGIYRRPLSSCVLRAFLRGLRSPRTCSSRWGPLSLDTTHLTP